MLPAGWAVQKFGPKLLLGLDNYLQGAALLLVPSAAKLGVGPLCLCMATMGMSQAPIFPGQSVMKRDFQGGLPAELRPWAIQFMRLSAAAGLLEVHDANHFGAMGLAVSMLRVRFCVGWVRCFVGNNCAVQTGGSTTSVRTRERPYGHTGCGEQNGVRGAESPGSHCRNVCARIVQQSGIYDDAVGTGEFR